MLNHLIHVLPAAVYLRSYLHLPALNPAKRGTTFRARQRVRLSAACYCMDQPSYVIHFGRTGSLHTLARARGGRLSRAGLMSTETKPLSDREVFFSQEERLLSSFMDLYRCSAIGMLVKGIAHNLNGSLQILSMQIELLQATVKKGEGTVRASLCTNLDECMKSLDKMTAMVEDLLKKGARHDDDVPGTVPLNALLEEELVFLGHNLFFKHQVKVKKILSTRLPLLNGYYVDFREGLSCLIVNAVEAMEEAPLKELKVATERGDHEVKVVIGDTGCGISDEVKPHLFKPFFTTKGGKHHGLGLFMVRELLSPYGASFQIASRKGETTFTVTFPLRPETESHLSGSPDRKVSLL